jgi:hypothetical protein
MDIKGQSEQCPGNAGKMVGDEAQAHHTKGSRLCVANHWSSWKIYIMEVAGSMTRAQLLKA